MTLHLWMANKLITMLKKISLAIGLLFWGYLAIAQNYPPKSNTLVTDYTNTLSAADKQQLENKLVAFDDSTSTQIAIVIIKSVGDYDINEYGAGLGRNWGIGQQGKNNGVLILVALDDRKLTIQTGYGVEGTLPDVIAQQIRLNDINPRFKQGDYFGGLDAATDDIIRYTKGEYKAPKNNTDNDTNNAQPDNNSGGSIAILVLIIVVILWIIFRNRGGGGQVIGSRGGASPFWWFMAGSMLGNSGNGGWGGFSGGGNDSGSGGGGDFGGFGGGDFGGGGSGGSW